MRELCPGRPCHHVLGTQGSEAGGVRAAGEVEEDEVVAGSLRGRLVEDGGGAGQPGAVEEPRGQR